MSKLNSVNRHSTNRQRGRVRGIAGISALAAALAMLFVLPVPGESAPAQTQAVPQSTAAPTISGSTTLGTTLTATPGIWTGDPTFAYQWVRCPSSGGSSDGSDCAVVGGATTQAYILSSGDVGSRLRVRVTASNADGSATAASNATSLVEAQSKAPSKVSDPQISGTARVGSTLTATQGTWTNNPTSFAYQWVRCPTSGGTPTGTDCAVIGGSSTASYVVSAADLGKRLRVRVTASNADGSATAASNPTPLVEAQSKVPAKVSEPRISGSPLVGSTLTATQGTWSGNPTSFSFQWVRCPISGGRADASDCATIGGATTQSYPVSSSEVGKRLRVRVTASNTSGSATVASNATVVVRQPAPKPAPTGCPAGTDTIRADQLTAPARLLIDRQSINPSVVGRSTRDVTVRFHVSACGGRSVQGVLVYATAVPYNQFAVPSEQPTGTDGWAQLTTPQLRGFPAARSQQLLVMFVRARKANENVLGGVSTRRLVSFPVDLGR